MSVLGSIQIKGGGAVILKKQMDETKLTHTASHHEKTTTT
jgi:hypothetical protein